MFPAQHVNHRGRIQSQNTQEISELFAKHGSFLTSVLTRKFSPQPDVDLEDLFQDFFISLMESPVPSDVKNIKSYLYRAIYNDIKDQYRKSKNFRKHNNNHQHFRKIQHRARLEEPSVQIEYKDMLNHIERKINLHLPEHEANAVKQKLLLGKSVAEGAENLNVQKRSFSRYLCSGLNHLRKLLPDLAHSR